MANSVLPAPSPITPAPPRLRLSKLCVAIQGSSPAELMDRAEAASKDFKFLELRLDSVSRPANALPYVKQFLSEHKDITEIATCRRKAHGGSFDGPLAVELEILTKAAQCGCQIIDLEVETAEEAKSAQVARRRSGGAAGRGGGRGGARAGGRGRAAGRGRAGGPGGM